MVHRGIHRVLVVDGGKLVGLITSLDLVGLL
jgi:CBS domain-containing protein